MLSREAVHQREGLGNLKKCPGEEEDPYQTQDVIDAKLHGQVDDRSQRGARAAPAQPRRGAPYRPILNRQRYLRT